MISDEPKKGRPPTFQTPELKEKLEIERERLKRQKAQIANQA
jgi:hypothetical protein